jgi:hypothetical protein
MIFPQIINYRIKDLLKIQKINLGKEKLNLGIFAKPKKIDCRHGPLDFGGLFHLSK